jgi:AGZA family xanthine/uracil permease-like MFS transporter
LGLLTSATLTLLTGQRDKLSLSECVMCVIFIAKFACL